MKNFLFKLAAFAITVGALFAETSANACGAALFYQPKISNSLIRIE